MSKTTEFNVADFEVNDTAKICIKGLDGEPLQVNGEGVFIEVYSPGSREGARADAQYAAYNGARFIKTVRDKSKGKVDPEDAEREAARLVAYTKTLVNFPVPGGAGALYANAKLGFITNQVKEFIGDWSNFQKASLKV